jgi:hypothetical protein
MDMKLFHAELAAERQDAARLEAIRATMRQSLVNQFAEFADREVEDE